MRDQYSNVAQELLDAVSEVVKGTPWSPPEGGILVDALVIMVHCDTDGEYGSSWLSVGSLEQAEGMARKTIRDVQTIQNNL